MSQATKEALRPCSWLLCYHIAQKKEKETASSDKMDVQMLRQMYHLVEDDRIYRLYQICIAPFSNNRSTLSRPVAKDARMTLDVLIT